MMSEGGSSFSFRASTEAHVHRHQGVAALLGVGVRFDVPIQAFGSDMLAPVALEAQYTKNFWLDLERTARNEAAPERLAREGMELDYLGLSLTVGFLR